MNLDSTSASTVGGGMTEDLNIFCMEYVSCMKVDGYPILPPLMTEKRREEMRRYREQAVLREKELRERPKLGMNSKIQHTNSKLEHGSARNESTLSFEKYLTSGCVSTPVIPIEVPGTEGTQEIDAQCSPRTPTKAEVPVTSTPRVRRTFSLEKPTFTVTKNDCSNESLPPDGVGDLDDAPGDVLCEKTITGIRPLNQSLSSVLSVDNSSALSYDGDEEKGGQGEAPSESDDHQSEDNFASAASSTGTFVIHRSSENNSSERPHSQRKSQSKNSYSSSEGEQENSRREPPPTVIRKPSSGEEQGYKRKRPAKYFDLDDEEDVEKSKCSVASSTLSSIPNRVQETSQTGLAAAIANSSKFSPVAITNFTSIAKSLTMEFANKFCTTGDYSSTAKPVNTPIPNVSRGSYDVRLSKEIPSSAEEDKHDDTASNSSDKENIDANGNATKHVRKLSYTLDTPSAALLEAVVKSKDKHFQHNLETVPSVPSSVGFQSPYPTPEKANVKVQSALEVLDGSGNRDRGDVVEFTSGNLSCLSLGRGKQAHLERFLGEQDNISISNASQSAEVDDLQQVVRKIQDEHETRMRRLAEQQRLEKQRIQEEFEREMEKLKEKFSFSLNTRKSNKGSPNSVAESFDVSVSSRTKTEPSSALMPVSTSDEKKMNHVNSSSVSSALSKKEYSVYQFMGSGNTPGDFQTSSTSHVTTGPCEISTVGLSKLQSRMQMMSPRMFRTPVDARSPLLKGLLFLDPLNKPVAPLRIPQKALEPEMKPKFARISAAVKGFLTRRLLNTEKVQIIVQTIRDTVDLLLKLYEEAPPSGGATCVKPQDSDLHQRLIQQLTGACRSFHDVFFKLSTKERMALIATDREKLKAKAMRNLASPSKPSISNATLKSIERRMSHRSSPKRDHRKSRNSMAHDPYQGSKSVKPKPVKMFNISPKRRRISYWDDGNSVGSQSNQAAKGNIMGNNFRAPSAGSRTQAASKSPGSQPRSYHQLSGVSELGETFIVPTSATQTPRSAISSIASSARSYSGSLSGRRDSTTSASNAKSFISAKSTQSSISVASSSSGINRSNRASTSRQPWNSGHRK